MNLASLTKEQFIDIMISYGWHREITALNKLVKNGKAIILEKDCFSLNNFSRLNYYKYCQENIYKILDLHNSAVNMIEYKIKNHILKLQAN